MQRILGRFYSDWQVAAKHLFCFLTLDRKPRLRSQSCIGPTTVGPDMYMRMRASAGTSRAETHVISGAYICNCMHCKDTVALEVALWYNAVCAVVRQQNRVYRIVPQRDLQATVHTVALEVALWYNVVCAVVRQQNRAYRIVPQRDLQGHRTDSHQTRASAARRYSGMLTYS